VKKWRFPGRNLLAAHHVRMQKKRHGALAPPVFRIPTSFPRARRCRCRPASLPSRTGPAIRPVAADRRWPGSSPTPRRARFRIVVSTGENQDLTAVPDGPFFLQQWQPFDVPLLLAIAHRRSADERLHETDECNQVGNGQEVLLASQSTPGRSQRRWLISRKAKSQKQIVVTNHFNGYEPLQLPKDSP
jgi:hypothetical protein